ncbi:MAG: hypothetical protein ACKONH_10615 [Planctomycetia bacterium]
MRRRRQRRPGARLCGERLEPRLACSAGAWSSALPWAVPVAGGAVAAEVAVQAVVPVASPALADAWSGQAGFVMDPSRGIATSSGRQFTHASMIRDGDRIRAYTTEWIPDGDGIWDNDRYGVRLFTTADGDSWVDEGIVLRPRRGTWCDQMTSFPGVAKVGSTYYMAFEGKGFDDFADIGLATSADGVHWELSPKPILRHTGRGVERINIGTPSLHHENGVWTLFYHAFDGRDCRVLAATGTSLQALTRVNRGRPIIDTSRSGIDSGTIGKRSQVIREGGFYYMAVEVSSDLTAARGFGGSDWSTILVRSQALHSGWQKLPGTLLRTTGSSFGFDGPELVAVGGQWRLYSRDKGAFTRYAVLAAASPLTFEAERDLEHQVGRPETDGWGVGPGDAAGRLVSHGPFTTAVPSGPRTATFRLLIDDVSRDDRAVLGISVRDAATGRVLARRQITRRQFTAAGQYQDFTVGFSAGAGQRLDFRVHYLGNASCRQDRVSVR